MIPLRLPVRVAIGLITLGTAVFDHAAVPVDPALPHYEPKPFTVPKDATYVKSDGTILLVGAEEMAGPLERLNVIFSRNHPGLKFSLLTPGSSAGAPAILFDLAPFCALGRELLPEEYVPFDYLYKRKPLGIRTGRSSYSRTGYSPPMLICVHRDNPISKLTTEEVARIFTTGGGKGDIVTWGQLGLTGEWARRTIRVLGVGQRVGEGVFMKVQKFGDYPFTPRYEGMKSGLLGARLAEDNSAIMLVDMSFPRPPEAKIVALAETPAGYYSAASYEDVVAGRYPYTRYTYLYINRDPAKPLDPFVKEYLRLLLSKEGQEALSNEDNGFLPLSAKDAAEELAKLN